MKKLKSVDLGWVAGIIEGEGYIGYAGRKSHPFLALQVGSTDRDVLERLQSLLGGGINLQFAEGANGTRAKNKKSKAMWRWCIYGKKAEPVLVAILPLMCKRRSAAIRKWI